MPRITVPVARGVVQSLENARKRRWIQRQATCLGDLPGAWILDRTILGLHGVVVFMHGGKN